MKQIINNVLYDTESSERITYYYVMNCKRDLYKTKGGKYFVVNWDWFNANGSIELKEESFVKILLGKIDINKYIEIFGAPEEA